MTDPLTGWAAAHITPKILYAMQQAFLLASAGALLGTLLAMTGVGLLDRWITATATYPLPFWMDMTVDGPVLVFVLALVLETRSRVPPGMGTRTRTIPPPCVPLHARAGGPQNGLRPEMAVSMKRSKDPLAPVTGARSFSFPRFLRWVRTA